VEAVGDGLRADELPGPAHPMTSTMSARPANTRISPKA
jgi:hypothetical protein